MSKIDELIQLFADAEGDYPEDFQFETAQSLAQQAHAEYQKVLGIVEQFARDAITDSIRATDGGYEFDDDAWECSADNAIEMLNQLGFPGAAIYQEIYAEEISEDEDDD